MQEWIIAMLVISVLLLLRDMAKTIFSEMKKSAAALDYDRNPQKEKMQRYAESFQKLANSFYGLPGRKDYLSSSEIKDLIEESREGVCRRCHLSQVCWIQHYPQTYQRFYSLLRIMEENDEEKLRKARADLTGVCISQGKLVQELQRIMDRERQNLIWSNKLLENRMAVAQQLGEMAQLMKLLSRDLFDMTEVDLQFRDEFSRKLKKRHMRARKVWVLEQPDGRQRYYAELCTRGGNCIPASEAAAVLSEICGSRMAVRTDGKTLITRDYGVIGFVEDVNFKILYGAAKVEASRESEGVVDTLEQLVGAGFSGETAARMVNSVLNLKNRNGRFSTVDISIIDLYSGMCHFLKAGAATTFINRSHWVETISSTSLALGLGQQFDFEASIKKLYEGDFLIMVTDGVLDALPGEEPEEIMKEIIMGINASAAQELGKGILERVLTYCEYRATDDMTVLAAGLWRK